MELTISSTAHKQIVDITEAVNTLLGRAKLKSGLVSLFTTHTTCALTTADLDPGTDLDMLDAFEAIIPKLAYRHPHDPGHVGDHILSSLIGTSLLIPFKNANMVLGTWQRVVLVELSGPRERKISVNII
jgi:secondary thiamine-phosphate synthase enzyme